MRILIMGLSGSGKSELCKRLQKELQNFIIINADMVRTAHKDWDFSAEGRLRQSKRLRDYCLEDNNIVDTIAPLQKQRDIIDPDLTIWMDTIKSSKYSDTDNIFEPPTDYHIHITDFNYVINDILKEIVWQENGQYIIKQQDYRKS